MNPCRYPTMERWLGEYRQWGPISLAPTAQWVTSGEDWSYGRQPRQKIRQGAMPQGRSRPSSSKRPDTYPTPAWQVAGGTNPLMSFPMNCGQRFSVPQRSFRAQQLLGGLLDSRMRKWLCSVGGRPLMMMKPTSHSALKRAINELVRQKNLQEVIMGFSVPN